MHLTVHHRIPRDDLGIGVVIVDGVSCEGAPEELRVALDAAVHTVRSMPELEPSSAEAKRRSAAREVLRNGTYKPTGRGKPASEYLARAAQEGKFPRINGPVDANNLVSLLRAVPISLWDLDLAATLAGTTADAGEVEFRLGAPTESYVFNASGQSLELGDLVVGCALGPSGSRPMVTPIKDSLATKLKPESTRLAAAIYQPLGEGGAASVLAVAEELLRWLRRCGPKSATVRGTSGAAMPKQTLRLEL